MSLSGIGSRVIEILVILVLFNLICFGDFQFDCSFLNFVRWQI